MSGARSMLFRPLLWASRPASRIGLGRLTPVMAAWRFIAKCFVGATVTVRYRDLMVTLPSGDLFGYKLLSRGTWEPVETALFRQALRPGMTVVDVGAHVGIYTMTAATLVGEEGRVYAFEPDPDNFRLLAKNIEANGLANVVPVEKAVSNTSGHLTLYHDRAGSVAHSLRPLSGDASQIEVDVVSLDEFLGDQRVDVVKVDVEGAEQEVFEGMRGVLAGNPNMTLFMEFNPQYLAERGASPNGLIAELTGCGFELYRIDERTESLVPVRSTEAVGASADTNLLCVRGESAPQGGVRMLELEASREST